MSDSMPVSIVVVPRSRLEAANAQAMRLAAFGIAVIVCTDPATAAIVAKIHGLSIS